MQSGRVRHNRDGLGVFFLAGLLAFTGCRNPSPMHVPPELPADVTRHIPAHRPFDRRPYEFIWAHREPDFHQWIDFERALGWRVETSEGVDATWERSQTVQLWDDYVGALSFRSTRPDGSVIVHVDQPPQLRDPVDTITLWIHGPTPPTEMALTLHVVDAQENKYRVPLTTLDWSHWRMAKVRLPPVLRQARRYPIGLTALEWNELPETEGLTVYVDGLSAFKDALEPIRFAARPRRPITQWPGPLPGKNRGPEMLSFPTRDHTVIPGNADIGQSFKMERKPDGALHVQRKDVPDQPRFVLHPNEGLFPIKAYLDDETEVSLLDAMFLDGVKVPPEPPLVVRHRRNQLYIEYAHGLMVYLSLFDDTLVLDIALRGGGVEDVTFLSARNPAQHEALRLPYLYVAGETAPLWMYRDTAQPAFSFIQIDPYRSNASTLSVRDDDEEERISLFYKQTTAGRRNDVHERLVLSASRELEAVLPVVPHPARPANKFPGGVVNGLAAQEVSYADLTAGALRLNNLGARDVLYVLPAHVWSKQYDSASYRLGANPFRGGDAALIELIQHLQSLGVSVALPVELRTLSPLNAFWHPDRVLRASDGTWVAGPDGTFLAKPGFALEWSENFGALLIDRFGPDVLLLNGHFDEPPWRATDYDERAPAAATFAQTFFAEGDLVDTLRTASGRPVFVDSHAPRWVAGLVDGLLSSASASQDKEPINPVFKLWRLHGLSPILEALDVDYATNETTQQLDTYLANALAYGNGVLLWPLDRIDDASLARNLYALRALQEVIQASLRPRILWADEQGYVAVEEALYGGAIAKERLYFRYAPDVEIWVNGGKEPWILWAGGREWTVPPSGWLALGPTLTALSLEQDGARIDYVAAPDYLYFDGRGEHTQYEWLKGRGPVVAWRDQKRPMEIIDVMEKGGVAVHRDSGIDFEGVRLDSFDRKGEFLGRGEVMYEAPWWYVDGPPGTRRWVAVSEEE